jgi:hypothetical protein
MTDAQQQIVPVPPIQFALIKRCSSSAEAVGLAFQNRKTHPEEAVEIWPVPDSEDRIVVREVMEEKDEIAKRKAKETSYQDAG